MPQKNVSFLMMLNVNLARLAVCHSSFRSDHTVPKRANGLQQIQIFGLKLLEFIYTYSYEVVYTIKTHKQLTGAK
jgi:hypothetical protein